MIKQRKLAVISDFHLDVNHFSADELQILKNLLTELSVTDLHFAGDISNDFNGLTKPFLADLEQLTGLSVTYNLGNHDMVGLSEAEIDASDFQVKWFGNTTFVSFHGWYDYSFMKKEKDEKKIITFKNSFTQGAS